MAKCLECKPWHLPPIECSVHKNCTRGAALKARASKSAKGFWNSQQEQCICCVSFWQVQVCASYGCVYISWKYVYIYIHIMYRTYRPLYKHVLIMLSYAALKWTTLQNTFCRLRLLQVTKTVPHENSFLSAVSGNACGNLKSQQLQAKHPQVPLAQWKFVLPTWSLGPQRLKLRVTSQQYHKFNLRMTKRRFWNVQISLVH